MKTIAKFVAFAMTWRGVFLLASPIAYLRFYEREDRPAWLRDSVRPWLQIPEWQLRVLGLDLVLLAALLFGLSHDERT